MTKILLAICLIGGCDRAPQFPSLPPSTVPDATDHQMERPETHPFYHLYYEIVRTELGRLQVALALIDIPNERLLAAAQLPFDGASTEFSEHFNNLEGKSVERVQLRVQPGETLEDITASYRIERIERDSKSFGRKVHLQPRQYRYPITPVNARIKDSALYDVLRVFARALDTDLAIAANIDAERLTTTLQDMKWNEALDMVLEGRDLKWIKVGDRLLVYRAHEGYFRGHRSYGQVIDWYPPVKIEWEGFGEVHRVSPAWGVAAPTIVERTKPLYTAEARENRLQGLVVVRALIDSDGRLQDAEIKRPLPFGLNEMALNAVREWSFSPATFHGRPVPVSYDVVVRFGPPGLH